MFALLLSMPAVTGQIAPEGWPDKYAVGFEDGFDQGTAIASLPPLGGDQIDVFWHATQPSLYHELHNPLLVSSTSGSKPGSKPGILLKYQVC